VTRIYTGKGDDGTTGLLFGGRVLKDSERPRAYGAVDEAQAVMGVARSLADDGGLVDAALTQACRDLWVLMAELATLPEHQGRLVDDQTRVSAAMLAGLERMIDEVAALFDPPAQFAVPGQTPLAAQLDLARTVVRRAERESVSVAAEGSHVVPYLNRLSSLLWAQARYVEGEHLLARDVPARPGEEGGGEGGDAGGDAGP
jgi:cob(I)alamin adenosyltransferase